MKTVDELAAIAVQLVMRVRDVEDPNANGEWLVEQLPDPAEWLRLCFALAAAVPDDRSWAALTAWAYLRHGVAAETYDEGEVLRPGAGSAPWAEGDLQPCPSPAAAKRHRDRGEPVCEPCLQSERARDRKRAESRRQPRRTTA